MNQSAEQQIESIVSSLEEKGVRAAPVVEALQLATSYPEAVNDLALAVMRRFPKGGTFLDAAFTYLPQEKWAELVPVALDAIERSGGKNDAADSVVECASLQSPSVLHPYLDQIFEIRPNANTYYECYPWRESGDQHFGYLRDVLERKSATDDDRKRAWTALHETRQASLVEYALSHADLVVPAEWSRDDWIKAHLDLVGLQREGRAFIRLCSDSLFHVQFPEGYFDAQSRPPWLARIHPSWKLPQAGPPMFFGVTSNGDCSLCGETLHRLLVLDPVPAAIGVKQLKRLELATCLSCLGWERAPLFYRHDDDGSPVNIGYDGPRVTPQFPVGPLQETVVCLSTTPRRWYWQAWGCSNSRENLNRVGGEPCWIQDSEYPNCPSCNRVMSYLLELDSDLQTADGREWLWGSGGIVYGFWCDECRVSGFHWQCT